MMEDFEEALRNIDVFLRTLVTKIVEGDDCSRENKVEPIEKLLRRKYIIEEHMESNPLAKHLIPLPHIEEPLIDVFEDDDQVKIFMHCHCENQKVTIHTDVDDLEICTKECQKLNLSVKHLRIEDMIVRCNNNKVLEVNIPKIKTTVSYGN